MDIPRALLCGLLVIGLFLVSSGESVPVAQDKMSVVNPTVNVTVTVTAVTPQANVTSVEQDQGPESRGKSPLPTQKKQTNKKQTNRPTNRQTKKREKRKNCFGFKMDRISDLSGMGCRKD